MNARETGAVIGIGTIGLILLMPRNSITAANFEVETGVLSPVGGHHLITLGYAHNLGISTLNLLAWTGLFITAIAVCGLLSALSSPDQDERKSAR